MKITQLREKDGNLTLSTTDLDTFLQKIKTETKTQPVSTFRQQLRYCLPGKRCNEADRLPKVLPAAEFRKTNGVCQIAWLGSYSRGAFRTFRISASSSRIE